VTVPYQFRVEQAILAWRFPEVRTEGNLVMYAGLTEKNAKSLADTLMPVIEEMVKERLK
jgi:hypothetical protein